MRTLKGALLAGAMMLGAGAASAENGEKPQYGGTLEIGTVYVTLSALSWECGTKISCNQPRTPLRWWCPWSCAWSCP